jgi:hypothetical protein
MPRPSIEFSALALALTLLGCDPGLTLPTPDAGCVPLCPIGGGGPCTCGVSSGGPTGGGCVPRSCPLGGGGVCTSSCGGGGGPITGDGGGGGTTSCSSGTDNRAVTTSAAEAPALSGGTMAVLRDGSFVIADADRARVWLVSADFHQLRQVALDAGDEPGRVVEGPSGHVFFTLRRGAALAELDVATGTLTRRLPTCHLPRGLAWRASDAQLVVGCLDGALETVDPLSGARANVPLLSPLSDVRDVVVDGARLLVTSFRSAELASVAADGTVTLVTPTPQAGATPHVAWRAVPRPGGGATFVRQQHRSVPFSTTSCASYGGFAKDLRNSGGGAGSNASVVQSEVVTVADSTALTTPLGLGFAAVVLPVDVAVSPTGRVAVLSAGTSSVTLLEPAQRRDVVVGSSAEGGFPTSVVFRGESAFVFTREPAQLHEVRADATTQLVADLRGGSLASSGYDLFHRATPSGLACASCHPEAGEDGHVWPFFEGARRTPTLRGGLAATKPFHWSGDLPTMASLMTTVMGTRMRWPLLSPERATAVEDWLDAQHALPPPQVDAAAALRGQALFESERTACASCHAGPQGTDNQTVDVGTGGALQVPRLLELARRGPWLHDGRLPTLEARFDPASGTAHGQVADLTAGERADLLEYLRSR